MPLRPARSRPSNSHIADHCKQWCQVGRRRPVPQAWRRYPAGLISHRYGCNVPSETQSVGNSVADSAPPFALGDRPQPTPPPAPIWITQAHVYLRSRVTFHRSARRVQRPGRAITLCPEFLSEIFPSGDLWLPGSPSACPRIPRRIRAVFLFAHRQQPGFGIARVNDYSVSAPAAAPSSRSPDFLIEPQVLPGLIQDLERRSVSRLLLAHMRCRRPP